MRFEYTPYNGSWLPLVPVAFRHGKQQLPPIGALVDTGATHSILPLELAVELGITIDLKDRLHTQVAGAKITPAGQSENICFCERDV